jgi:septum site-determining protein MinD
MGKVIGVISLKGGVGKTSSVVSLGSALAERGKKILLVDANFSCPNLGMHLNLIDPEVSMHHVLSGDMHIENAIHEVENFHVLPSSIFPRKKIDSLKLKEKLAGLKRKYDVIILDSSPALNEETLAVLLASEELYVVSTPDAPTLGMTMKAIKLAKSRGTPISGIILNKVHGKKFELSLKDIERTSEVPVMAVVPHDIRVLKSLSASVPFVRHHPESKGGVEYRKLAALIVGERFENKRKNLFRRFDPPKQEINREIFYETIFH